MSTQVFEVDVYRDGERTLYTEGEGFTLRFNNNVGYLKHHVEDEGLRVQLNETSAVIVTPWDEQITGERVESDVKLEVTVSNGDAFVVGWFAHFPYTPYYGMSEDGQVYRIQRVFEDFATDELLGVDATDTEFVVENLSTGISKPMDKDSVEGMFEEGGLTPVIKIL